MANIALLHPPTYGSTQLAGVFEVNPAARGRVERPTADGAVEAYLAFLLEQDPRLEVSTYDVAAALSLTGFGALSGGVTAWDALVDADGVKLAEGAVQYSAAHAVTMPRRLSASQEGPCTVSLESVVTGGTWSVATGQTLSAFADGGNDVFYGLGPVHLNGTPITGVRGVEVDFGIGEGLLRTDGDVAIAAVAALGKLPSVLLRVVPDGGLGVAGVQAALDGEDGFEVWFRKRAAFGYAAGSVHVKLQFLNGQIRREGTTGRQREVQYRVIPSRVTATATMSISTAAALPA